jgi:signal transduction histidine kinase
LELRLKSQVIEERASKLVSLKDQALQDYIAGHDQEQLLIAKELHENIAQDLATIRLYLNMAENKPGQKDDFISAAQNTVEQVTNSVKNLSYSFSPSTLETSNLQLLMENLRDKYSTNDLRIQLQVTGDSSAVSFLQSLNCVRIAEAWLQVLLEQPALTMAKIDVAIDEDVQVVISDNAAARSFADKESEIFRNALYYRVIGMNGRLKFVESPAGMNELHIQLPIVKSEVTVAESI